MKKARGSSLVDPVCDVTFASDDELIAELGSRGVCTLVVRIKPSRTGGADDWHLSFYGSTMMAIGLAELAKVKLIAGHMAANE